MGNKTSTPADQQGSVPAGANPEFSELPERVVHEPEYAIFAERTLSLSTERIATALIWFARPYLHLTTEFAVPEVELEKASGVRRKDRKNFRQDALGLKYRTANWRDANGNPPPGFQRGNEGFCHWLAYGVFADGYFFWQFPGPVARDVLGASAVCAQTDPQRLQTIRSIYGLQLYKIARYIRSLGQGASQWQSVDRWREWMLVDAGRYRPFKDFSRSVLVPAAQHVSRVTELSIRFEYRKTGRNVEAIRLIVETDPQAEQLIGSRMSGIKDISALDEQPARPTDGPLNVSEDARVCSALQKLEEDFGIGPYYGRRLISDLGYSQDVGLFEELVRAVSNDVQREYVELGNPRAYLKKVLSDHKPGGASADEALLSHSEGKVGAPPKAQRQPAPKPSQSDTATDSDSLWQRWQALPAKQRQALLDAFFRRYRLLEVVTQAVPRDEAQLERESLDPASRKALEDSWVIDLPHAEGTRPR